VPLTLAEYARRVIVTLGLLGLAVLIWRTLDVLVLIFAGGILAIVLTSLACVVARFTRLRGAWALVVSTLGLILLLLGFATLLGWRVADQLGDLTQTVTHAWSQLRAALQQNAAGRMLIDSITSPSSSTATPLTGLTYAATGTVGAITYGIVILFIGLFLAANPPLYRRGLMSLVPRSRHTQISALLEAIVQALRQWLGGVLVAMLCVGVITGIGLWLLGIPLALSLAFLAGLLEFIPYVGPIVSSIPAIVVGFASSPMLAVEVAALYLLVHLIEGYILVPIIQKKAVALPPALGITAVVVFGVLIGPLGIVLAHPLMVTAIVVVRKLYIERNATECVNANQP
jgi:predicted PurR-regulated permease PerM